jgi:hypothetical protein
MLSLQNSRIDDGSQIGEGLNSLYQLSGGLFLLLGSRQTSFPLRKLISIFSNSVSNFEQSLKAINGNKVDSQTLFELKLLKKKHYIYACYLGAFSTIPTLQKKGRSDIFFALFSKASMAVGTKVMDNINDEWHTPEAAIKSIGRLQEALIKGTYKESNGPYSPSWLHQAENTALEITAWTGRNLKPIMEEAPFFSSIYYEDVKRWIEGQQQSIRYKNILDDDKYPSISDYLEKISEKSTGSLWADPDLCFLEKNMHGLDEEQKKQALAVRSSSDLLIKSCLIYDDIADFFYDMKHKTINSMLINAYEKNLITPKKVVDEDPSYLLKLFYQNNIVSETMALGDSIFNKALDELKGIPLENGIVNPKGLEFHCRLLRLFNLRKVFVRDKKPMNLKFLLDSFRKIGDKDTKHLEEFSRIEKSLNVPLPI